MLKKFLTNLRILKLTKCEIFQICQKNSKLKKIKYNTLLQKINIQDNKKR